MSNIYKIETEYRDLISVLVENGGELTPEIEQALQINQRTCIGNLNLMPMLLKNLMGK